MKGNLLKALATNKMMVWMNESKEHTVSNHIFLTAIVCIRFERDSTAVLEAFQKAMKS